MANFCGRIPAFTVTQMFAFMSKILRPGEMQTIRLTDKMGCSISNTSYIKVIDCFRKVDAKKFTRVAGEYHVS